MLKDQIKNIKSDRREFRRFGLLVGSVLALLGAYLLWRQSEYAPYLLAAGVALVLVGLVMPGLLKPIYKAWMTLAILMGWLVTGIILSVLFYAVFTLVGLLARLMGKRFLNTRIDRTAPTYWIPRENRITDKGEYERQY
jgi:hypothetical protein